MSNPIAVGLESDRRSLGDSALACACCKKAQTGKVPGLCCGFDSDVQIWRNCPWGAEWKLTQILQMLRVSHSPTLTPDRHGVVVEARTTCSTGHNIDGEIAPPQICEQGMPNHPQKGPWCIGHSLDWPGLSAVDATSRCSAASRCGAHVPVTDTDMRANCGWSAESD